MKRIVNLCNPKITDADSEEYLNARINLALDYVSFTDCNFCGYPKLSGHLCGNCDYESPQYPLNDPQIQIEIEE